MVIGEGKLSGELTITRAPDAGGNTRLVIEGELDSYTAPRLRTAVQEATANDSGSLTLDVADVSFVDSTGISILVWAHKQVVRRGEALVLRSPTPDVYRVLEITGLTHVFRIE